MRGLNFFASCRTNRIYEEINKKTTENEGGLFRKLFKGVKQSVLKFTKKEPVVPQSPFKSNLLIHAKSLNEVNKTENQSVSAHFVTMQHCFDVNRELASTQSFHINKNNNGEFVVEDKLAPPLPKRNPGMIRPVGGGDDRMGISPFEEKEFLERFGE